jgi:hypothetical protein
MKLLSTLCLVFLLSCSKDNKTCWKCELSGVSGYRQTVEVCNDGDTPTGFTGPDGSDLNSACVKK